LNSQDIKEPGLLIQYLRTMSSSDKISTHGGEIGDPVYDRIVNRDIKEKIENRSMNEKEYAQALKAVNRSLMEPLTPKQASSSALAVRGGTAIVLSPEKGLERTLNNASTSQLAIESGFTYSAVARHQKKWGKWSRHS